VGSFGKAEMDGRAWSPDNSDTAYMSEEEEEEVNN
jgi:hypothetical protein